METIRKPFQGVTNIIRFNWHFYLLSFACISLFIMLDAFFPEVLSFPVKVFCCLIAGSVVTSLFVSYYIYDLSGLYKLSWLDNLNIKDNCKIVNVNAGFDETSSLISAKYRNAELAVVDFYNPEKHTELSIKRARKAYPAFPDTITVTTKSLPFENNSKDIIFVIFSAHEIRDEQERTLFFKELRRVIKSEGKIIITEHLRDLPNFLAYAIGFFHFYSGSSWRKVIKEAGLYIERDAKITPFITTFIVRKHGITS